jgi:all-trans-retinol 13,14-reductase
MRLGVERKAVVQSPLAHTKRRSQAEVPESVDVAIIGAGPGGLTAGAYLAKQGLRVAVFDAHYVAGGCATMFERGRGENKYNFDIGLHYIGDCGPDGMIPKLLAGVGIHLEYEAMDPDGFDEIVLPDLRFRIPADREIYEKRLISAFPHQVKGIKAYCRLLREVELMSSHMGAGGSKLKLLGAVALKGRMVFKYRNATIGQFFEDHIDDPNLRAILCGQNGDYGVRPSRASAMLHCGLANHYFKGAFYPRGGGQVLADRLSETIEDTGGAILLRKPVRGIVVEDGQAVGVSVEVKGGAIQTVRAKTVISNADLKQTLLELLPVGTLTDVQTEVVKGYEMAAAIFITCVGVSGDVADLGMGATNYWQFDTNDMEDFYDDVESGNLSPRCAYITSASLKDPHTAGHAPEGVTSLEIMTILSGNAAHWGIELDPKSSLKYRRNETYLAHKKQVEDNLINRLETLFPGIRDRIVFVESATPVTHARYTWAAGGSGYGLAATPEQFMGNRPGYRGPVPGLFLCGASTRAGHGIVGAMMSGYQAAKRAAYDHGVSVPRL